MWLLQESDAPVSQAFTVTAIAIVICQFNDFSELMLQTFYSLSCVGMEASVPLAQQSIGDAAEILSNKWNTEIHICVHNIDIQVHTNIHHPVLPHGLCICVGACLQHSYKQFTTLLQPLDPACTEPEVQPKVTVYGSLKSSECAPRLWNVCGLLGNM